MVILQNWHLKIDMKLHNKVQIYNESIFLEVELVSAPSLVCGTFVGGGSLAAELDLIRIRAITGHVSSVL